MAVTVKATCPECGDIRTSIDNVILRILEGSNDTMGEYRFLCPTCKKIVLKPAGASTISLLASSGVRKEFYNLSLEILERPRDEDAKPISMDDLIDLHLDLEQDEEAWISRMKHRRDIE